MNTVYDYEKVEDQLEEILEKNRDAEKGYRKAADNADSPSLKSFFARKATDRNSFNSSLKREMMANYHEIEDNGTFAGNIHRAWMDVKALFSGNNDEAMLEESIKGDKAAVEEYEEVLQDKTLPLSISQLVRRQMTQIQSDLSTVKRLEDLS